MKSVQKTVLNAVAKIGIKSAEKACGSASFFGVCQPKEPAMLKELMMKKF
jgi:cyclic lactone autoinducer peptide